MILDLGKITSKGQITIPAEIRKTLGISRGDRIIFEQKGDDIIIKKAEEKSLVSLLESTSPLSEKATKSMKKIRDEWD
ncbi:MAG: AbrB/MazE/SpoVT family DNA-binding domain-containing protein [Thermoplasmataceae archaeon]|nr:AbrB/MazE/SpoVT family DNA-binding domain-containing protein [Candidatus Thermoplasmatota archaeon]